MRSNVHNHSGLSRKRLARENNPAAPLKIATKLLTSKIKITKEEANFPLVLEQSKAIKRVVYIGRLLLKLSILAYFVDLNHLERERGHTLDPEREQTVVEC